VKLEEKDDGCFWISFQDYVKFFYITTICYYIDGTQDNTVADMHEPAQFGMTKFMLAEDHPEPLVITCDQVNARFVDETMLGSYKYPSIRLMLTKVNTRTDAATQTQEVHQAFVHGNCDSDTHVSLPIQKGLKSGTYLILYQADFTEEHTERKLVISVYAGREIELKRVSVEDYQPDNF